MAESAALDLGTVERLLALLVLEQLEGASDRERAVKLSSAGLSISEIAELLGTTNQVVSQHLYSAKTKRKKKSRRKTTKKRVSRKKR